MFITDDRGGHRHKGKGNKEERRKRKQKRYQRGGSDGARFNLSGLKEGPRGPSATALHRPSVNHFHPRLATFKKFRKKEILTRAIDISHIPGGASSMGSPAHTVLDMLQKKCKAHPAATLSPTREAGGRGVGRARSADGGGEASDWGDNVYCSLPTGSKSVM